jgi:pyruvate formate lyase activating enzyme
MDRSMVATKYLHRTEDGRSSVTCAAGVPLAGEQLGLCFVRMRRPDAIVLTAYGRSSAATALTRSRRSRSIISCRGHRSFPAGVTGHFRPGSPVLSFGTAGCNLGLPVLPKLGHLQATGDRHAGRRGIARAAAELGYRSVASTYNDG